MSWIQQPGGGWVNTGADAYDPEAYMSDAQYQTWLSGQQAGPMGQFLTPESFAGTSYSPSPSAPDPTGAGTIQDSIGQGGTRLQPPTPQMLQGGVNAAIQQVLQAGGPQLLASMASQGWFQQFPDFNDSTAYNLGTFVESYQNQVATMHGASSTGVSTDDWQMASMFTAPVVGGMANGFTGGAGAVPATAGSAEGFSGALAGTGATGGGAGAGMGFAGAGGTAPPLGSTPQAVPPVDSGVGGNPNPPGGFTTNPMTGDVTNLPGGAPPPGATGNTPVGTPPLTGGPGGNIPVTVPIGGGGGNNGGGGTGGGGGAPLDSLLQLLGGGLGIAGQEQNNEQLRELMGLLGDRIRSQPAPYDTTQQHDNINQYFNDPSGWLNSQPGFAASNTYLENEANRIAAQGGNMGSGARIETNANILGRNAQNWYTGGWNALRDGGGLGAGANGNNPSDMATMLGITNSLNQGNQNSIAQLMAMIAAMSGNGDSGGGQGLIPWLTGNINTNGGTGGTMPAGVGATPFPGENGGPTIPDSGQYGKPQDSSSPILPGAGGGQPMNLGTPMASGTGGSPTQIPTLSNLFNQNRPRQLPRQSFNLFG